MKPRSLLFVAALGLLSMQSGAQSALFDFNDAPIHTSLPIDLTVNGISAHFAGTGQNFSIQQADALGFTPAGFSGFCIYPNSVFQADLVILFSRRLTDISILCAIQEYNCDPTGTMKVTGYMDGVFVASNTAIGSEGVWPTVTLSLSATQGFNSVVIHYDKKPPTCSDWGPIFLADDMYVTAANDPPTLTGNICLDGLEVGSAGYSANLEFRYPGTTTVAHSYPITLDVLCNYDAGVVAEGTWDVSVKFSHWLRETLPNPVILPGPNLISFTQMNGDANGDNSVNIQDLNSVFISFGVSDPNADLDGSGLVDLPDMNIVFINFGMSGAN
jgi:hypothetical protein